MWLFHDYKPNIWRYQIFTSLFVQMGQLGFHVQHDGLITEVENFGYAWQTGLRQGSRLVEVDVNTFLYFRLTITLA